MARLTRGYSLPLKVRQLPLVRRPWTVLDTFWTSVRGGPPSVGPKELVAWPARGPSYLVPFLEGR
jgi:hypothetical protein